MRRYNPMKAPDPDEWLGLDEQERALLVEDYHRRKRVRIPGMEMHAMFHAIVENQIALDDRVVVETLANLQAEGLDRHEALHAIANVLARLFYSVHKDGLEAITGDAGEEYHNRVRVLTAESWRNSG